MNEIKLVQEFEQKAIDNFSSMDIEGLISSFGIELDMNAFLNSGISGQIEKLPNEKYKISVNRDEGIKRRRFTAAHELGHYIFHKSLLGDGVDDNKAYRSDSQGNFFNQSINKIEEIEANQFAASVLMPSKLIKALYHKYSKDIVNKEIIFKKIADTLEVSYQAFTYRIGDINIDR